MIPGFKDTITTQEMMGPFVYCFYTDDEGPLYIGKAGNCGRLGNHHKGFDLVESKGAKLEILPCPSDKVAYELELVYIKEYVPRYNSTGIGIKELVKKLEQKRAESHG